MFSFGSDGEDDIGIVFRDMITLALAGFVASVLLLLPHVNARAKSSESTAEVTSPGSVIITADWPPDVDADVDLWVQGPGDVPVGYSNKGGGLFNLLRDDLGHVMDVSGMNAEVSFSRGSLPGQYIANVHLYRNISRKYPVVVKVVAAVRLPGGAVQQIVQQTVELKVEGSELTAFRFRLDADNKLVADSVDAVQVPLRSGFK